MPVTLTAEYVQVFPTSPLPRPGSSGKGQPLELQGSIAALPDNVHMLPNPATFSLGEVGTLILAHRHTTLPATTQSTGHVSKILGRTSQPACRRAPHVFKQVVVGLVTADVLKAIAGNEVRRQQPGGMAGLAAHLLTQRRHATYCSCSQSRPHHMRPCHVVL